MINDFLSSRQPKLLVHFCHILPIRSFNLLRPSKERVRLTSRADYLRS